MLNITLNISLIVGQNLLDYKIQMLVALELQEEFVTPIFFPFSSTDYTGDLVLALEPTPKGDADLVVTMDSVTDDLGISLQPLPPEVSDDVEARMPRRTDEEGRMPRRTDEEARLPRLVDEEARIPRRIDEEGRMPRRVDEVARLPRGIDEERGLPRRVDDEARFPRGTDEEEKEQETKQMRTVMEDEKPKQTKG